MAQYQTYPGTVGASDTLEKLKKLAIPSLRGKRFLDVGCNEGFFCGYAAFDGAAQVIGIDHSEAFVTKARSRFGHCDFRCQSWEKLPEGKFDVILLASALHYAADQPALVRRLIESLDPEGTLVLEMGVASGDESRWVTVTRGIDEREFPTMAKVVEMFSGYAWKHMGSSVTQSGDPVRRQVFHLHHRKPVAYLLMQPPGAGKSTLARELFGPAGVSVVSGDATIAAAVRGELHAPTDLLKALAEDFSNIRIDQAIERVRGRGLARPLLELYFSRAIRGMDFALDAFLPGSLREEAEQVARELGYLPILLTWTAPFQSTGPSSRSRADAFFSDLEAEAGVQGSRKFEPRGHVDEAELSHDRLNLRGWAFDDLGRRQSLFDVAVAGRACQILESVIDARPDVQQRFGTPTSNLGFRLLVRVPEGTDEGALSTIEVRARGDTGASTLLHLSHLIRARRAPSR